MKRIKERITTLSFVFVIILLIGCNSNLEISPQEEESLSAQPIQVKEEETYEDFRVETFCSLTKMRTGVARLTWISKPNLIERQRIDVTVFKQGFEKGFFSFISPTEPKKGFQLPDLREPLDDSFGPILELNFGELLVDEERNEYSVNVEGLEPGLNYLWRILTIEDEGQTSTRIVKVEAPVCVADMEEEK